MSPIVGTATSPGTAGATGQSEQWNGVLGVSMANGSAGVAGVNERGGNGIYGRGTGNGVWGHGYANANAIGVVGISDHNDGVAGISQTTGKSGVLGIHHGQHGQGVWGQANRGRGVVGLSQTGTGVYGRSEADEGVRGESLNPHHGGVVGISLAVGGHGVYGTCDEGTGVIAITKRGTALFARADVGKAGHFQGDIEVTGAIRNADLQARLGQATQKVADLERKLAALQAQLNEFSTNINTRVSNCETQVRGIAQYSHAHSRTIMEAEADMAVANADEVSLSPSLVLTNGHGPTLSYPEEPMVGALAGAGADESRHQNGSPE